MEIPRPIKHALFLFLSFAVAEDITLESLGKPRKAPMTTFGACRSSVRVALSRLKPTFYGPEVVHMQDEKGLCKWWASMPCDLLSNPMLDRTHTSPL
jgi:hypothetical protein